MTKTVAAEEFVQQAESLLRDVANGDEVLISNDGGVVAKLVPTKRRPFLESLRGSVTYYGDILEPADHEDEWDVNK